MTNISYKTLTAAARLRITQHLAKEREATTRTERDFAWLQAMGVYDLWWRVASGMGETNYDCDLAEFNALLNPEKGNHHA